MHYCSINASDVVNGPGIRVTLFVSGCRLHCANCFNQQAQNFEYGDEFTTEVQDEIIKMLSKEYIDGLTILGGEPFEPENQRGLYDFIKRVRDTYPNKTIWMFSGYTYEHLPTTWATELILQLIDVLIDGPFVFEKRDLKLKFRGSSNQRIIDVKRTLDSGRVVLYDTDTD